MGERYPVARGISGSNHHVYRRRIKESNQMGDETSWKDPTTHGMKEWKKALRSRNIFGQLQISGRESRTGTALVPSLWKDHAICKVGFFISFQTIERWTWFHEHSMEHTGNNWRLAIGKITGVSHYSEVKNSYPVRSRMIKAAKFPDGYWLSVF